LVVSESAFALTIDGDCNVVAPNYRGSGSVTYEINCNNITNHASVQIEKILNIIQESSHGGSASDFERALDRIFKVSNESLELIKKTRAPRIVLSTREFPICGSCYDTLDFINSGGFIERLEAFDLLEIAGVELKTGEASIRGKVFQCPFEHKRPFDSVVAFVDYDTAGYGSWIGMSRNPGESIGYFGVSNSYRGKKIFEKEVFSNYNLKRKLKRKAAVDINTLQACVRFLYQMAVKIVLVNYYGQQYEQYYFLKYEEIGKESIRLVDILPYEGSKGFDAFADTHNKLKASRRSKHSTTVPLSVLADFIVKRSK